MIAPRSERPSLGDHPVLDEITVLDPGPPGFHAPPVDGQYRPGDVRSVRASQVNRRRRDTLRRPLLARVERTTQHGSETREFR